MLLLTQTLAVAEGVEFPALQVKLENHLRAAAYDDDTAPILFPRPDQPVYGAAGPTTFGGWLLAHPERFYGLERYEVTPFDTALEGAGQGATLGLLMGAVGTTAGLFGEETAWYIAGGMAALGALFGTTYGADPAKRIRYRWIPPPELEGEDALHQGND